MGRFTAVSDIDYMAEGQDPPRGQTRACSMCGQPYDVLVDDARPYDAFVLRPLCDRCFFQSLDRAMADRQKARTK